MVFNKYEGAGNDFIIVKNSPSIISHDDALLLRKLCDRHFGIGSDGLILIMPSERASARMRMFTTGQGRKTGDTDAHAIALVGVRITGLPRSCQMSNWRSCACWSTGADASVRNTWGALAVAFMYPDESHQRRIRCQSCSSHRYRRSCSLWPCRRRSVASRC